MFPWITSQQVEHWMGVTFVKFLLWKNRAKGMRCAQCKQPVPPEQITSFAKAGCPACQGLKLEMTQ
jgi:Zn finger protein HypA/HybF involved in hydrogenase expression